MNEIYVTTYCNHSLNLTKDIFKFCASGNILSFNELPNKNIYQKYGDDYSFVPLFLAFHSKNEKLVGLILDIYECDLRVLFGTRFTRALIAYPIDQNQEFLTHCDVNPSETSIPVLLKSIDLTEEPKLMYLNRKLTHKEDLSIKLIAALEDNNNFCDINWNMLHEAKDDSFLHLAIFYGMKSIIDRLLANRLVDKGVMNLINHTPLHYAIHVGNLFVITHLINDSIYSNWHDEPSYLYQAAVAKKPSVLNFVIEQMLRSGKSLDEILSIRFPLYTFHQHNHDNRIEGNILHVLAENDIGYFLNLQNFHFEAEKLFTQTTNGMTILHIYIMENKTKIKPKIRNIKNLCEKFPSLLIMPDVEGRLPLHFGAFCDSQSLYLSLFNLSVKVSHNENIFYDNLTTAVETIEKAIELNSRGLTESYWRNFVKIIDAFGARIMQKLLACNYSLTALRAFLSTSSTVNLNEFYNGSNAFLTLLHKSLMQCSYKTNQETFDKLNMLLNYSPIEDVNAKDSHGNTFFMYMTALCLNQDNIDSLIRERKVNCDVVNLENYTCLHYAALNRKNTEIVRRILCHAVEFVNHLNDSNELAIHVAIKNGNFTSVENLVPLISAEMLCKEYTQHEENLIQYSSRYATIEILQLVYDCYEQHGIHVDVNKTNCDGNNLLLIALECMNHPQVLALILQKHKNELNFHARNRKGQTFMHKFAICQSMVRYPEIFQNNPFLNDILNEHLNDEDEEKISPIDSLVYTHDENVIDAEVLNFLLTHVSKENIRICLPKIAQNFSLLKGIMKIYPSVLDEIESNKLLSVFKASLSNLEKFKYILEKISSNRLIGISENEENNLLHLLCEKNDVDFIDAFIKFIEQETLEFLTNEKSKSNHLIPYELLNQENKQIFENVCFPTAMKEKK